MPPPPSSNYNVEGYAQAPLIYYSYSRLDYIPT